MISSGPDQEANIFIYKAMDRTVGYKHLKERADTLINIAEIKASGVCLWLLRESNSQKGMLTVDIISWDNNNEKWNENSTRMVLHKNEGWINSSNMYASNVKEAIAVMQFVTAEDACKHIQSLNNYLNQHPSYHLKISNRLNPGKYDQAESSVYSGYINLSASAGESSSKVPVMLTPPLIQAITCELSHNTMKDPVVLKKDIVIKRPGLFDMLLNKGKSYERYTLEFFKVDPQDFIPNFTLQKVISRLGCGDKGLIDNLESERLLEPVQLETMSQPYIMPSSHSISKVTLESMVSTGRSLKCPETNKPFLLKDAIPNRNLEQFINAWPDYHLVLVGSLKEQGPDDSNKLRL